DDDCRHRTTAGRSPRGPARPSSAGPLLSAGLCLHLGLLVADLGSSGFARNPVSAGWLPRANRLSLPRGSSHLAKARRASPCALVCGVAGGRAMVPGGLALRSVSDFDRFPGHPGGLCCFSPSGFELDPCLPEYIPPRPP